ncbi:MAG TPA: single-stranded-DNA-specific exonuclease RecJ [Lactobacillaceae bacterium]|jgi:single-stranded-DNA-specific exonuclease
MSEWQILPQPNPEKVAAVMRNFSVEKLTAQLLVQREITDIAGFLQPNLAALHDPFLLHDMDKAVERIQEAAFGGEQILIYGDYDLDGVSATAVLFETLQMLGADVDVYLPDRFADGYGPNLAAYQRFIDAGVSLFITVDNGISGANVIEQVQAQGVDVIVTDHHALPEILPQAAAVVHPRHPEGEYPFAELSGVGVAFKVAQALLMEDADDDLPVELLDLVALGEIADMVPLRDENRILVHAGLKQLNAAPRPGLQALLKNAGHAAQEAITAETVSFKIAPRLNAVGRVADAKTALDLLIAQLPEEATALGKEVEGFNTQRQEIVANITRDAQAQAAEKTADPLLLLTGADWHEGVLGIVASKIVETTGKPVILLTPSDDDATILKGSGRSVGDLDLFALLQPLRELFVSFGGHAGAVGLSLAEADLASFNTKIQNVMRTVTIHNEPLPIALTLPADGINESTLAALAPLQPFGAGNEQPIFAFQNAPLAGGTAMGSDKQHLKFTVANAQMSVEALGFNRPEWTPFLAEKQLTMAATLSESFFRGRRSLSLMLRDIQVPTVQPKAQTTPLQQEFKVLYKFIASHPHVNFQVQLQQIAVHLKMSAQALKIMLQVFLELNFVTIENGFVRVNVQQTTRPLTESPTYRRYIEHRG